MGCKVTYIPLGELAKFESGGTPSKKEERYWNGTIPWISAKTLVGDAVCKGDLFITKQGLDAGGKLAPKGSLLLLTRGSGLFKRIPLAIAEKDVAYNQDIKCIEATAEGISNRYLFYTLKALEPAISAMLETTGIGAGKLATDRLKPLRIHVLDEAARLRVTYIADCINSKLSLNTKLNGYLEELARAVYVSAMQEHADIASLCDLAEFNPETYSPKENWSAVSYIDTSALMLNDLAGLQHFNPAEEKLPTRARRKVSNGDILYSTVRPNQNHYGLLYSPEPHTLASTAFAVIRPNDTIMSPLVYLALTDARITKTLQQLAETSTSTIPSIRPVDLERIAVLVPSDEYGSEIADQIGTTFKQIDCNKRENRKLAAFRDALLPKLMSGEIDVSKIDLTQLNSHLT